MALSVLAVAGSDGQEQDKVLAPQYENLVEQLRDPSSTIRGRAILKLSQLDLSARLEVTAALFGCDSQERDKPLNPKYEKVVQQLGDPSYTVRQQALNIDAQLHARLRGIPGERFQYLDHQ